MMRATRELASATHGLYDRRPLAEAEEPRVKAALRSAYPADVTPDDRVITPGAREKTG
jgi:hypothetical protein